MVRWRKGEFREKMGDGPLDVNNRGYTRGNCVVTILKRQGSHSGCQARRRQFGQLIRKESCDNTVVISEARMY